jgi:ribose 5-phosphate isomerase B
MKVALGADHAGYHLKEAVKNYLVSNGHRIEDFGPFSDDRTDYPDHAHPVAIAVENKTCDLGIVICGSGNGINMTVNKHQGIRSALCWNVELAELARQHNNANVLALPARFISEELALKCVEAFLTAEFEGGRHEQRVSKISCS